MPFLTRKPKIINARRKCTNFMTYSYLSRHCDIMEDTRILKMYIRAKHSMTNTCAKFQPSSLSGSCFMAGGWKTPPPRVISRAKSPGLIGLSLISQHAGAIFYLHGPIPCINILIKDNTATVNMWSYYARQDSKLFKNL